MSSSHGAVSGVVDTSTITATQTDATLFNVTSTVPTQGNFTFSSISWGYFDASNVFQGTGGSLGTGVTLALNGTAGKVLKVEFVNTSNVRKTFFVTLAATHQNFTFDLTGFSTVPMAFINFVSDQVGTTAYTVETKGLKYTSVIAGTTYDEAALTSFGAYLPSMVAGAGNSVTGQPAALISSKQFSADEFEYDYDLSPSPTSFSFVSLNRGVLTFALPSAQYVFAARGAEGQHTKVEVLDRNGNRVSFVILLTSSYKNYALDLTPGMGAIPAGFEWGFLKEIVFVQDGTIGSPLSHDVVKVETKGMNYVASILPSNLADIQTTLVQKGLGYFVPGVGVDPGTHFPYDHQSMDGSFANYTQPTLIGFYAQILGDVVKGTLSNGLNTTQALTELNAVLDSLVHVQSAHGWHNLIPWLDLATGNPTGTSIGFLDNANMTQSLAVMVGALQSSNLSGANLVLANQIITKTEGFIDAQAQGYHDFIHPTFGLFQMSYDTSTGQFSSYVDRLAVEVRGAIAFLVARFPGVIPSAVWDNLVIKTANYTDSNGNVIRNLTAWDGSAFQFFWPMLRNDERDFVGFRDMLYNQLVSQMDWAARNNLPGLLSASGLPEGGYYGSIGVPGLAEQATNPSNLPNYYDTVLMNVGSTYALASALQMDPYAVLGWLDSFDNIFGLNNTFGFYDAARSSSEISHEYIGIDVASAVLGLGGTGPDDFEIYLRNKGLESAYNLLYDSASKRLQSITRTTVALPTAPQIPDRSFAVFSNFATEGTVSSFPSVYVTGATGIYGAQFVQNTPLANGWGGHYWKFNHAYDAQANQLVMHYTTEDTPVTIKIELKDANGQVVYTTTQTLANGVRFGRLAIQLPDQALLNAVKEVDIVVDQDATGDTSFDFTIHSFLFQHFAP